MAARIRRRTPDSAEDIDLTNPSQVPIERSALLVIDVQDSFRATPGRWDRRSSRDFEAQVDRLIQAYRTAGLPVIYVLHTDGDEGFDTASPYFKLMDFLKPREGEPVLLKNTRNAFTSTDLQKILDARGVRRLAITGIQTEQCCETTTRLAADLGYDVDFMIEATLTFPIADPETGEELGTDEILRRTAFVLRRRFARITPVEHLVAELRAAGGAAGSAGTAASGQKAASGATPAPLASGATPAPLATGATPAAGATPASAPAQAAAGPPA
jgi:nicotinamidase-related amidase